MQTRIFRITSSLLILIFFLSAWIARVPLGNLLILYTLLALSAIALWFPWKMVGSWCIGISLQESHTLWKAVADSMRRQDSYFRIAGTCIGCESIIYEGAHYCTHCSLPTSLIYDGKWCMRCNSINPNDARYCACCCYEFQQVERITPPPLRTSPLHIKTGKYPALDHQKL